MVKIVIGVAVAFTDKTWSAVITDIDVENLSTDNEVEKAAEDKVLKAFSDGARAVAFVKTIWAGPGEEESGNYGFGWKHLH